jgi:hypothetical protein
MPALAVLLARHRIWFLAAAALMGLTAAGGLSPSTASREPARPSLVAGIVADAIPAARAATVEVVIAANETPAAKAADAPTPPEPPAPAAAPSGAEPPAKASKRKGASVGITIDDDEKVHIRGPDGTREYDSFEAFVEKAPWIAGLVFVVTFLVFLTPILVIALVIWYKMRKNRMLNETMLRLAEKGVMPPTEAFEAVSGGRANPMSSSPSVAPLYEQAKAVRQKAVWSDLRKGIILGAVGLGFTFYSMLDDGSPNFVGLILLFVGLAYIVLWYVEDRQMSAVRGLPPPPPPPPSA